MLTMIYYPIENTLLLRNSFSNFLPVKNIRNYTYNPNQPNHMKMGQTATFLHINYL
ncbi:hypothetical protein Hanom_Chr03g00255541 [Helianthus anomalus]